MLKTRTSSCRIYPTRKQSNKLKSNLHKGRYVDFSQPKLEIIPLPKFPKKGIKLYGYGIIRGNIPEYVIYPIKHCCIEKCDNEWHTHLTYEYEYNPNKKPIKILTPDELEYCSIFKKDHPYNPDPKQRIGQPIIIFPKLTPMPKNIPKLPDPNLDWPEYCEAWKKVRAKLKPRETRKMQYLDELYTHWLDTHPGQVLKYHITLPPGITISAKLTPYALKVKQGRMPPKVIREGIDLTISTPKGVCKTRFLSPKNKGKLIKRHKFRESFISDITIPKRRF